MPTSNRHNQVVEGCESSIGHQLRHRAGRPFHSEADTTRAGVGRCGKVVTQLLQAPSMRPSVYGATLVPKGLKGFLLALHADREPSRENAFEQQATCQQIRIELGTCGRRTAGEAELRRKAEDRTSRGEGSGRFDG